MQPIHEGALVAMVAMVMAACSNTSVTSTWKAPGSPTIGGATGLHKMLVVAHVPTESVRRNLEDRLVRELAEQGVQASPSHQYVEESDSLEKDRMRSLVERRGFDSLLVADYLGTTQDFSHVPGNYYDYFGWYGPDYRSAVDEWSEVKLEFRLFDATAGGRLVWTATTSTYEPSSADKELPKVADKVVARLEKDIER